MPVMPPRSRRRPLSFLQLRVKGPLGFLYLLFLAVLSVLVMIDMTLLWYATRGAAAVAGLFGNPRRGEAGSHIA
jgi:hypothetical protein